LPPPMLYRLKAYSHPASLINQHDMVNSSPHVKFVQKNPFGMAKLTLTTK
jgi:hypothetical protein